MSVLSYQYKSLTRGGASALGVLQVYRALESVDARKKTTFALPSPWDVTPKSVQDEKRIAARLTPSVGGLPRLTRRPLL